MHARLMLLLHHAHGVFHQVANDAFHIAAHIANLGKLGCFHLDKGRLHQLCQAAGNLSFAHARWADHQNILGIDFLAHFLAYAGTAVTVAQGNRHSALGLVLADDIAIQLAHDFARRHFLHRHCAHPLILLPQ